MKNQDYIEWRAKVVELNPDQVKDLRCRLQPFGENQTTTIDFTDDWLFTGLFEELCKKGLASKISRRAILRSRGYKAYQRWAPGLMDELDRLLAPTKQKRMARTVLSLLVGQCLVHYTRKKVPGMLTASKVLMQAEHIMEALNDSFPGYITPGLFQHIIQANGNSL